MRKIFLVFGLFLALMSGCKEEPVEPKITLEAYPVSPDYLGSCIVSWRISGNCSKFSVFLNDKEILNKSSNDTIKIDLIKEKQIITVICESEAKRTEKSCSIIPGPQPELPSFIITANPDTIDYGTTSTIRVETNNAKYVESDLPGFSRLSGLFETPILFANTTYHFKAINENGSIRDSVRIVVREALLSVTITATPDTIMKGETTRIDWSSEGPIVSVWSNVPGQNGIASGSTTEEPLVTTTYMITVTGQNGKTASDSVTVVVNEIIPTEKERILCLGPLKEVQRDIYQEGILLFALDTTVECERDDRWVFQLNHTIKLTQGVLLCEDEARHTITFNWSLSGDTLFGLGEPRFIKVLSSDSLRWEFKDRHQLQDGTIVPTTIIQAFVRRD